MYLNAQNDGTLVGRPAKKPAHGAQKALSNYGKPKIPVFLMGGEDCIPGRATPVSYPYIIDTKT